MPARFKPNDILSLPDHLQLEHRQTIFKPGDTSIRAVVPERYASDKRAQPLDGKHVRILGSTFTLLGMSVSDDDSYTYEAVLVEPRHGRWVRAGGTPTLAIAGNLVMDATVKAHAQNNVFRLEASTRPDTRKKTMAAGPRR